MLPANILNIDFSGKGLFALWNSLKDEQFEIRGGRKMTPDIASQVLLHSVFGTYRENLVLVEWMTGRGLQTRREFGEVFRCKATDGSNVKASIIPFQYVSKLASAAQTDFFAGGKGQIARVPVFSGKAIQRVTLEDDLIEVLRATDDIVQGRPTTQREVLAEKLDQCKKVILARLDKDKIISYGTTQWFKAPAADGSAYGDVVEVVPELHKKYFFGNE